MATDEEGFQSTKGNVEIFLRDLRDIFNSENYMFILPDREDKIKQYTTKFCLSELDYEKSDVIEELKTLTVSHYYGTVKDENNQKYNEYYYEFGKVIQSKMVYIKLKIQSREKKQVLCISFHFPEHEMIRFPYK